MDHRNEDKYGRKDVAQDKTIGHVEAVKGTRSSQNANIAFDWAIVVVVCSVTDGVTVNVTVDDHWYVAGTVYVDDLKRR